MKKLVGGVLLSLLMQPAWSSEDPPGCAWLCGNWVLDTTRSEVAGPIVEIALAKYKEPGAPKSGSLFRRDAAASEPVPGQLSKEQVQAQLVALLTPPASLVLAEQGKQVVIRAGGQPERLLLPGETRSRVDARGSAKISAEWKKDALLVEESFDSKHGQTETFALLPDGTLQVSMVLERPEARTMRLRSLYRRR